MKPTLRQLQLFSTAAREPSFRAAAETLCLSPSALSLQLKQLEHNLGVPLFDQIGRRKFLTEAGRELQESCSRLFAEYEQIELRMAQLRGSMCGTLRIAAVTSAKFFIPHLMGAFHRQYPAVRLKLQVANRDQIIERLENNLDDLVVMAHTPEFGNVSTVPFLDNPLVLIAPPDHHLAGRQGLPIDALNGEEFLLREPGSGTRHAMEALFERHRVAIDCVMELGSSEAIKQGVMAGLGISVLSRHCVWLELQSGHLVELDVAGFPDPHQWYAVSLQGKHQTPVAEAFLQHIIDQGPRMLDRLAGGYRPLR